jgi:hypothetical protein
MSTREALIRDLEKQPEAILKEVRHYLAVLTSQQAQKSGETAKGWPNGYFQRTAGAFSNEVFDRPSQPPFEKREGW